MLHWVRARPSVPKIRFLSLFIYSPVPIMCCWFTAWYIWYSNVVCWKINQFDSFCLMMFPLTSSFLSQLAMLDDTRRFVQVRAMSTDTWSYNPLTHQILAYIPYYSNIIPINYIPVYACCLILRRCYTPHFIPLIGLIGGFIQPWIGVKEKLIMKITTLHTIYYLVGGFKHEWIIFHHILGIIIPIDSIFSRWLLHHQPDTVAIAIVLVQPCELTSTVMVMLMFTHDNPLAIDIVNV